MCKTIGFLLKGKWKVPHASLYYYRNDIPDMYPVVIQKCSQGINLHSQRKNPYPTSPFCCPLTCWVTLERPPPNNGWPLMKKQQQQWRHLKAQSCMDWGAALFTWTDRCATLYLLITWRHLLQQSRDSSLPLAMPFAIKSGSKESCCNRSEECRSTLLTMTSRGTNNTGRNFCHVMKLTPGSLRKSDSCLSADAPTKSRDVTVMWY